MTYVMQAMTLLLPPNYNFKLFSIAYNVLSMLLNITIETLLTITHELYTKMFHDQKFRVSSCV